MRLFVAVNFNEDVIAKLLEIQQKLVECSVKGNFSRPENMHLTLAFIGETSEGKLKSIIDSMEMINEKKFAISFNNIGSFKRNEGELYYVNLQNKGRLGEISALLRKNLKSRDIILDDKRFKPHVTIGREVFVENKLGIEVINREFCIFEFTVDKISLMKSEHTTRRLTYAPVYEKVFR